MRKQKVWQWSNEGLTLMQMAQRLIDEKLHPIVQPEGNSKTLVAIDHEAALKSAHRNVCRIRERLIKDGRIANRNAGRPVKKQNQQAE